VRELAELGLDLAHRDFHESRSHGLAGRLDDARFGERFQKSDLF
jgi:hypothetical protein